MLFFWLCRIQICLRQAIYRMTADQDRIESLFDCSNWPTCTVKGVMPIMQIPLPSFQGNCANFLAWGLQLLDQSKSSPFLSHTVTTVMMAFRQTLMSHKQCQIDIKWVTNVYCHQSAVCLVADIKKRQWIQPEPFFGTDQHFFCINHISDLLISN